MKSLFTTVTFALIIFSVSECARIPGTTSRASFVDELDSGLENQGDTCELSGDGPAKGSVEKGEGRGAEGLLEAEVNEGVPFEATSLRTKRMDQGPLKSNASLPLEVLFANRPGPSVGLRPCKNKVKRKIKRQKRNFEETPFQLKRGDEVCFNGVRIQAEGEGGAGQVSVLSSVQDAREKELFGSWKGNMTLGLKLGDETYVLVGKKQDETSELLNAEKSASIMEDILSDNDVSRYKKSADDPNPNKDSGYYSPLENTRDVIQIPRRLQREHSDFQPDSRTPFKNAPRSKVFSAKNFKFRKPTYKQHELSQPMYKKEILPRGDRDFGAMDFPLDKKEEEARQRGGYYKRMPFLKDAPVLGGYNYGSMINPSGQKEKWRPDQDLVGKLNMEKQYEWGGRMAPQEQLESEFEPRVTAWEEKVGGGVKESLPHKNFDSPMESLAGVDERKEIPLSIDPSLYEPEITRQLMGESESLDTLMSPELQVESYRPQSWNSQGEFHKRQAISDFQSPEGVGQGNLRDRKSRELGRREQHSGEFPRSWGTIAFGNLAKDRRGHYGGHAYTRDHLRSKSDWMKPFVLNIPYQKEDTPAQGEERTYKGASGPSH